MLYTISIIGHNDTNPRIKDSTETKSSSFFPRVFKTKLVFKFFLPCGWRATFMEISDIYLDFNVCKHLRTVGWEETVGALARSGCWDITQQCLGFVYQNQSNWSNRLQKPRLDVYANATNAGLLQQQPVSRPRKKKDVADEPSRGSSWGSAPLLKKWTKPEAEGCWWDRLLVRQTWAVKDCSYKNTIMPATKLHGFFCTTFLIVLGGSDWSQSQLIHLYLHSICYNHNYL